MLGATISGAVVVVPQAFALPASTVATTIDPYGAGLNFDGYTCGASGLYWVFYNDGNNWGYRTSSNGNTWSAETTITTSVPGNTEGEGLMAFNCISGTIYYAGGEESGADDHVFYNSGALNPSGTISWAYSPEQSFTTTYYYDSYPSITTDSNGNLWVAIQTQPNPTTGSTYLEVWEDAAGTWIQSSIQQGSGQFGQILALQGGKMALIYGTSVSPVSVKTFNGAGWNPTTVTMGSGDSMLSSSAVAIGTNIEICTTDYSNVYFASLAYGVASATLNTLAAGANSCSLSTDGIQNLAAFFALTSGTAVEEVQSSNGGTTFGAPSVLSAVETHLSSISAAFAFSTSPAGQIPVVWLAGTSPFSIRFANVAAQSAVQESVTIDPINGGPMGAASVSGCSASASSIPMDGLPHTFTASGNCSLTLTVPNDGANSRYRFPGAGGGSTTWTYTTSASGSDAKSVNVFYQYLTQVSYSVMGGTGPAPSAPTLSSVEAGTTATMTLSGAACQCWLDGGALWFVPTTIGDGVGGYWQTAQPTSGTVAGPQTVALIYSYIVTTVTTTQTSTITTTSTTTYTSPTTTTTTVTTTQTTGSGSGSVPSSSSLACAQQQYYGSRGFECTDLVYTADNGTALGTVSWAATGTGSGTFSQQQCNTGSQDDYGGSAKTPNDQGGNSQGGNGQGLGQQQSQLTCEAQYTASGSGVQTLTATYSGDPYHGSSSSTSVVFVGSIPGSKATAVSVTCGSVYLTPGESTTCVATVSAANGTPTGTISWTSSATGSFSHASCNGNGFFGVSNQLTCQAAFTPASKGQATVEATYGGDSSHTGSVGTFLVFVQTNPYAGLARQAAVLVPTGLAAGSVIGLVVLQRRKEDKVRSSSAATP